MNIFPGYSQKARNKATLLSVLGLGTGAVALLMRSVSTKKRLTKFQGQVVFITGASRGLGLALAEEFAKRGARLVLCARDAAELERAQKQLVAGGAREGNIVTIPADLRHADQAAVAIQKATEAFGRVDILVNNAGVIMVGPIENQTVANFHTAMETNFFSGVHCTLAVLPQMLARQSGSIVNIASIGGKVAVPHLLPYTASKFAVVGFSQGLSAEVRSRGVHVLTVSPGLMRTGSHLHAKFTGDSAREYRWFSLLANLPVLSASAQAAACSILRAVARKSTELVITPQAVLAARLAQTVPELTSALSSVAQEALLPEPVSNPAAGEPRPGSESREHETWPASQIGWKAAERYNEVD